jgi:hypothetical protein
MSVAHAGFGEFQGTTLGEAPTWYLDLGWVGYLSLFAFFPPCPLPVPKILS